MVTIKNKEIRNASWIIACKIAQSFLSLVINMFTARYLGPAGFGTIHYAASLVTFVTPIMQLGLNSIIVQEIVHNPEDEGKIVGTSIILSVLSSLFCIIGLTGFVSLFNAGEKETILVCCLYSVLLVFQAIELLQYWFQAKLLSKYTSIVMLIAYLFVSLYKTILLITQQSIYMFAITNALDYLIIDIALIFLYHKLGGRRLSFSWNLAWKMLSKSKFFILSSLMISIFSQTDRIMLKLMLGESATGYYSAAISCALLTNFVFSAVIDSARPSIFSKKRDGDVCDYENSLILTFSIIIYLSLAQCVFMTIFSDTFIGILYGSSFDPASAVLKYAVWYTTFSYIGAVRSIWILAEEKHRFLWIINLLGASTNVVLNVVLIPLMGVKGAAIATIVTQFATNVLFTQFVASWRKCNYLILKALNPKIILDATRKVINKN